MPRIFESHLKASSDTVSSATPSISSANVVVEAVLDWSALMVIFISISQLFVQVHHAGGHVLHFGIRETRVKRNRHGPVADPLSAWEHSGFKSITFAVIR